MIGNCLLTIDILMLLVTVGAQYMTTTPNEIYEEEEEYIPFLEYQPVANLRQLELLEQKEIRLGYIAAGHYTVDRVAVQISGAMTLAVKDVNEDPNLLPGYNVSFYFGNTTGEERDSLLKMAQLWKEGVLAFFGPDLTCDIEARFAAAVNLPMISYGCEDSKLSNKEKYPTFARTTPTDKQTVLALLHILKHFDWKIVSIISAAESQRKSIVSGLEEAFHDENITIQSIKYYEHPCYDHFYGGEDASCKFQEIIEKTAPITRIYIFLGELFEIYAFLEECWRIGLLENGEYIILYVNVEEYSPLRVEQLYGDPYERQPSLPSAYGYRSVLQIYPSPVSGDRWIEFRNKTLEYLQLEPFFSVVPENMGTSDLIVPANAAYLYDAVHNVYIPVLNEIITRSNNNSGNKSILEEAIDGTRIMKNIVNRTYKSVAGNVGYIDENGDAFVDFVVVGAPLNQSNRYGYNIETLAYLRINETTRKMTYVAVPGVSIPWISGRPEDRPRCGFHWEYCKTDKKHAFILASIFAFLLLSVLLTIIIKYRNYRYEQDLMGLLWKIDYEELDFRIKGGSQNTLGSRVNVGKLALHAHQHTTCPPSIPHNGKVSQMTSDSRQSNDPFRGQIFTEVARYRGQCVAIKKISKRSLDLNRTIRKELKIMREIKYDNLNAFLGACIEPSQVCIVSEYCRKGSLQDILENEDVKLDHLLIASIISDVVRGMIYLHSSEIHSHGCLKSSNCLIDSRWVVRVSDYGLAHMRQVDEKTQFQAGEYAYYRQLLWKAPELLRDPNPPLAGTQKGDVYSFAIILYEIALRDGPYGSCELSPQEIVKKVQCPEDPTIPFRPNVMAIENCEVCVLSCMQKCWDEDPDNRPDFKAIRNELQPLRRGMKSNILDNMISILETYADNLEDIVENRTQQLIEEKKKTDNLLHQMLPRAVANHLKRGMQVVPESFDCVTIFFSDIVGFTSLSSQSTPFQVVDLLNDLYTLFDTIISYYDVYKVETIGDAYMIVSGLPIRNSNRHAGEIGSTALHLLDAVQRFRIRHKPNETLKLRIGVHSGPVVAGVVGSTMPRYCLFGDTVNTASRMESNGEALKIHVSTECHRLLTELTGYILMERGLVTMKGKGELLTYWLIDQDVSYRRNEPLKSDSDDHLSNYESRGSNALSRRAKLLSTPPSCSTSALGSKDGETKLSNQVLNALGIISDDEPDAKNGDPNVKKRPHSTCVDSFSHLDSTKPEGITNSSSVDHGHYQVPENGTTPSEDQANESTCLLTDANKKIRFSDSALTFKLPVSKVNNEITVPKDVETAV